MKHPIEFFLAPFLDGQAQVAILALCGLMLLDIVFGSLNAISKHVFSSTNFRTGLVRKLSNLGLVLAAAIVDAMLLGGLNLGWQPVLLTITVSLAVMELWSLLEIFADMHPEISGAPWYQMLVKSKADKRGDTPATINLDGDPSVTVGDAGGGADA